MTCGVVTCHVMARLDMPDLGPTEWIHASAANVAAGAFFIGEGALMARENAVLCPHCNRGPFVDLLQHAAIYGGRAHDPDHLELALRLAGEEKAAKSAKMAQFSREVSDDDGDGNQAGMAEALRRESDRTEKAMADLARGLLRLLRWGVQAT